VLLKRPDGCKLDRTFSTQWRVRTERMSSGQMMLGLYGVQTVWHVVRMDGTVTDGRSDGMARSSGRLTGN
jgi:hypothetical protein